MQLYHGTNGKNILNIMATGQIIPNQQHEIFFGRYSWQALYMHGGDIARKASFVISVEVAIPNEVKKQFTSSRGVQNTLKVVTPVPLKAKVRELFVRRVGEDGYEEIRLRGDAAIRQFLQNANASAVKRQ